MEPNKPWYASRGVWGGIVTILSLVAGFLGYTVGPEDREALIIALSGIGGAVGSVVAVVGRVKATKKITK